MLTVDLAAEFTTTGTDGFQVAVDLAVQDGETVVVLGPSGSGKTLLLETIAGFHEHTGTVCQDGRVLSTEPPEARDFGFVFQDHALFPHRTVRENVAFGTRYRDTDADPESLLADLGVAELADRYPETLSGGEKQRVALARALAVDPGVVVLDEPLSALDVPTRESLRAELGDVLADRTTLVVTHDRTTARALADRIAVMHDGEIVQLGTPEAVFERPNSPVVARFTGSNCLPLDAVPGLADRLGGTQGGTPRGARGDGGTGGTHLAIRPDAIRLRDGDSDLEATVERVTREDATSRVTLSLAGASVTLDAYSSDPPAPGTTVGLAIDPEAVTVV